VQFIGKEADRWEEEHIIGNQVGEMAIAYGDYRGPVRAGA
jgi:hypothetical protein